MKKQILIIISLLFIVLSCSKDNPVIPITEIKLQTQELNLQVGTTSNITATVLPENTTDDKKITWSSSDNNIATVNNGTVTAVNIGETIITAKAGTITSKCIVKVLPINVSNLTLNVTEKEIKLGESFQLIANIIPDNSTDKNLTWQSSNENIVKVNNGMITGIGVGNAIITVSSKNGVKANCSVKVSPINISGITVYPTSITIAENRTAKLTYKILPENATNKSVIFSSSNESIFTIDQSGNIVAKNIGTAQATVKTVDGNYTAICDVDVVPFTREIRIGFKMSSWSNPGGYVNFNGGINLNNYSLNTVFVKQFMVLDNNNTIIYGIGINRNLSPENSLDYINVSFSNVYKARAVFLISYNGKEYLIEKSII